MYDVIYVGIITYVDVILNWHLATHKNLIKIFLLVSKPMCMSNI